jgi:hypothetical protein
VTTGTWVRELGLLQHRQPAKARSQLGAYDCDCAEFPTARLQPSEAARLLLPKVPSPVGPGAPPELTRVKQRWGDDGSPRRAAD